MDTFSIALDIFAFKTFTRLIRFDNYLTIANSYPPVVVNVEYEM